MLKIVEIEAYDEAMTATYKEIKYQKIMINLDKIISLGRDDKTCIYNKLTLEGGVQFNLTVAGEEKLRDVLSSYVVE